MGVAEIINSNYSVTVTVLPWWSVLIVLGCAAAFVLTLIFFLSRSQRKPGRQ